MKVKMSHWLCHNSDEVSWSAGLICVQCNGAEKAQGYKSRQCLCRVLLAHVSSSILNHGTLIDYQTGWRVPFTVSDVNEDVGGKCCNCFVRPH